MLLRAAMAAGLLATATTAPLQCGHTPDAELREDETPGDALWRLSQRFQAAHDEAGERRTLEYLVDRYPSSRWISAAKGELSKLGPRSAAAAASADGGE